MILRAGQSKCSQCQIEVDISVLFILANHFRTWVMLSKFRRTSSIPRKHLEQLIDVYDVQKGLKDQISFKSFDYDIQSVIFRRNSNQKQK